MARTSAPRNTETETLEQAQKDAKEVKALTFEQTLAGARILAIKEFPGDITVNVADKEAKDEKTGKPLVSAFRIPAETARELYEVQAVQGAVHNRWRELEPKLTEPDENVENSRSLFPAPECFENIVSDSHQGLKRVLQLTNARFVYAVQVIQTLGKKGANQTAGENAQFIAAKQQKVEADKAITRAIETMHQHWKNRQAPTEGEAGSTRKTKGIKILLEALMLTLTRRMQSKRASKQEAKLAAGARMALQWILIDPKACEAAFLAWEKERTAKSQQDQKDAQDSTKQTPAADVPQVNPEAKAALDAEAQKANLTQ